jgi:hypothetical protein
MSYHGLLLFLCASTNCNALCCSPMNLMKIYKLVLLVLKLWMLRLMVHLHALDCADTNSRLADHEPRREHREPVKVFCTVKPTVGCSLAANRALILSMACFSSQSICFARLASPFVGSCRCYFCIDLLCSVLGRLSFSHPANADWKAQPTRGETQLPRQSSARPTSST